MSHIRANSQRFSFWGHFLLSLSMISLVSGLPNPVSSENHPNYYYLHISSCRAKNNALLVAEKMRSQGYNAVTSYEAVSHLGYRDRVYIGPFSSLEAARLKRNELLERSGYGN